MGIIADQTEEHWQSYNPNGEPDGHALTKAEARAGLLHGDIYFANLLAELSQLTGQ